MQASEDTIGEWLLKTGIAFGVYFGGIVLIKLIWF